MGEVETPTPVFTDVVDVAEPVAARGVAGEEPEFVLGHCTRPWSSGTKVQHPVVAKTYSWGSV